MAPPLAKEELRRAGGGRIVAERDRVGAHSGDLAGDVEVAPVRHRALRRADFGFPGPKLEGLGDAEAGDPAPLRVGQRRDQRGVRFAHEVEDALRRRVGKGAVRALADGAAEVDQDEVAASPSDLEAHGEGAVRIERHRNGRLSDAASQRRLPLQEAFRLEPVHDRRRRLHRKSRQSRHLDLRQGAKPAHQRKQEPFVVEANAGLIGAARDLGEGRRDLRQRRHAGGVGSRARPVLRLRHPPPLDSCREQGARLAPRRAAVKNYYIG